MSIIIVNDDEDSLQFAMEIPSGMSDADAKRAVTECYTAAVAANPEEWNFGEVSTLLHKQGFKSVGAIVWAE
jgi:hypothetical protein